MKSLRLFWCWVRGHPLEHSWVIEGLNVPRVGKVLPAKHVVRCKVCDR